MTTGTVPQQPIANLLRRTVAGGAGTGVGESPIEPPLAASASGIATGGLGPSGIRGPRSLLQVGARAGTGAGTGTGTGAGVGVSGGEATSGEVAGSGGSSVGGLAPRTQRMRAEFGAWMNEISARDASRAAPTEEEISTLTSMFPNMGRDDIVQALQRNDHNTAQAVEALLQQNG
jgi:hypothetical protein